MGSALLERPTESGADTATEPYAVGISCTVGRSRVRHAALMIPDEHGRARLIPACGIGVSPRSSEDRVSACWTSNVVTCRRSGCKRSYATASGRPPVLSRQLQLDFDAAR